MSLSPGKLSVPSDLYAGDTSPQALEERIRHLVDALGVTVQEVNSLREGQGRAAPSGGNGLADVEKELRRLRGLLIPNRGGVESFQSGDLADRPGAGREGRFYLAEDATPAPILTWDDGSAWQKLTGTEYGSNANGEYLKFENGAMMCWLDTGRIYTVAAGASVNVEHTFAVPFVASPGVAAGGYEHSGAGAHAVIEINQVVSATTFTKISMKNGHSSQLVLGMSYVAMGRWK